MFGLLSLMMNSIASRVVAVTFAGIVAVQIGALTIMLFPGLHALVPGILGEEADAVAELVWMIEHVPEELEPYVLSIHRGSGRYARIEDSFGQDLKELPRLRDQIVQGRSDVAARLADRQILFGTQSFQIRERLIRSGPVEGVTAGAAFLIAVEMDDDRVLLVELAPFLYLFASSTLRLVLSGWVLFVILQSAALAVVVLRPIRRLEIEAGRIGLSELGFSVSEEGPLEMRRIAGALNRMRSRLAGLVQEREQIIAAIAHDIRTSITKIRLRLDSPEKIEAEGLDADLSQMETLLADMLTYARAESPDAPSDLIELQGFIERVARRAPFDVNVVAKSAFPPFTIVGDELALQRLFDNLLENARRYGKPPISIEMRFAGALEVAVCDHGDGLPEDLLEKVFKPFARAETSRNRATGGTGLGLGIARAIARAHGADLHLRNHDEGGLEAVLTFPEHLNTE